VEDLAEHRSLFPVDEHIEVRSPSQSLSETHIALPQAIAHLLTGELVQEVSESRDRLWWVGANSTDPRGTLALGH
jgi:hypothetical protein